MSSDTFFSLGPGPELYPDALQRPRREAYRTFKTSFKQSSFPIPFERAGQRNLVQEYARKVAGALSAHALNKEDRQKWRLLVLPQSRGGGKTTALDELRFQLLRSRDGKVPIPVSFNGFTALNCDEVHVWGVLELRSARDRLFLAFFARIAFVVLDHKQLSYESFLSEVLVPFVRFQLKKGTPKWKELFASLFEVAVANERQSLVFLVDEIAMLDPWRNDVSLTSLLKFVCFEYSLSTPTVSAVIVSSLDLAPFEIDFKTKTGTRAQLLELPSTFRPGELLASGHWFHSVTRGCNNRERAVVSTALGFLCTWPRGMEWLFQQLQVRSETGETPKVQDLLKYAIASDLGEREPVGAPFPDGGEISPAAQRQALWIGLRPCSSADSVDLSTVLDAAASRQQSVASLYSSKVLDGTVRFDAGSKELVLEQPSLSLLALRSLSSHHLAGGTGTEPSNSVEALAYSVLDILRDRAVSVLECDSDPDSEDSGDPDTSRGRVAALFEDVSTQWLRLLLVCRYDARAFIDCPVGDDNWANKPLTPPRLVPGTGSYVVCSDGTLETVAADDQRFADFAIPMLPVKYMQLEGPIQADTTYLSREQQEPAWSQLQEIAPGFVWVVRCRDTPEDGSQGCDDLVCWRVGETGGLRMVMRDAKVSPAKPRGGQDQGRVAPRAQRVVPLVNAITNGREMAACFTERLAESYDGDVRCCQVVISLGARGAQRFQLAEDPRFPCLVSFFESTMRHFGPLASVLGLLCQDFESLSDDNSVAR